MKRFADLIVSLVAVSALSHGVAAELDYHTDIAPLLRQYCAACHNDDDFDGDFSVERYLDLEEGGSKGVMLRPGNSKESYLMKLMSGGTEEPMPPADDPQPTEGDLAIFRQWIEEGAKGPGKENDISILSLLTVPDLPPAKGKKAITALAYSNDGGRLAIARFGGVEITNGEGQTVQRLGGLSGKVNAIEFAPGKSDRLVTASGIAGLKGVATLWEGGKAVRHFGEGYHRDILYDATFSPDGKWLATGGYDAKIAIWEVESGERLRTIEIHNGAIYDLAFSPDGNILASASGDMTVKLWRVSDGLRLDTFNQPQGEQYSVAFSPDGKFVFAGGADNRIRMYRLVSKDKPKINPVIHSRFAHEDSIIAMEVSNDGKWLASSSDDRSVKLWSLPSLKQVKAWGNQPDTAPALVFTGEQKLISGRLDGATQTWSYAKLTGLSGRPNPVESDEMDAGSKGRDRSTEVSEIDAVEQAMPIPVSLPTMIRGTIDQPEDTDHYSFSAKAGQPWVFRVNASMDKSPLDSKLEILNEEGEPVERVRLQAVRDSWFTFRGKNSIQANDFRVHNWGEMELNEYLYCNGEVVKLWLYPRGPDSGFTVYPGFGNRHNYFGTSGLTHALGEPCYVVEPIPAGVDPVPNGLPVYTLYFENDDDPLRLLGNDSRLEFTAPKDGEYQVRISDVRGFGGKEYAYQLSVKPPRPGFFVKHDIDAKKGLKVAPGTGREFVVTVVRHDGFDGPIEVEVNGLPKGLSAKSVVIERGQHKAMGVIWAAVDALGEEKKMEGDVPEGEKDKDKDKEKGKEIVVTMAATATVRSVVTRQQLATLGSVMIDEKAPKLKVAIHPDGKSGDPKMKQGEPLVLTIRPGETITAMVRAERIGFGDRILFGKEDSGRNLAHGIIIDNIGLSGLMIPEEGTEQRFFITASKWVPDSERVFFLRATAEGGRTTQPIVLRVKAEG